MDSEFMEIFAALACARDCEVIRFEFSYMAARRITGNRRPPDREPVLTQAWRDQVAHVRKTIVKKRPLLIGGKSMGGRMASLVADELAVNGLVCLGYPFHPAAKPAQLRIAHLAALKTPTLIIQGTRDPLGSREEVESYSLAASIQLQWLEDGDHDFKPRVKSGYTQQQHIECAVDSLCIFIDQLKRV